MSETKNNESNPNLVESDSTNSSALTSSTNSTNPSALTDSNPSTNSITSTNSNASTNPITTPSPPIPIELNEEKIALVYSELDEAGKRIAEEIKKMGVPKWAKLYKLREETVYANLSKIKEDYVVFLSKHQSSTNTKSLTIHMIGNYGEAKFGGKARELCGAMPRVGANYLRALEQKNKTELANQGFLVTMEATHHGPYTKKDCVFIEIGSTLREWKSGALAKIIAEIVVSETQKLNKDNLVIGLGGGHYATEFSKLVQRKNYAFGHICPKHNLGELNLDLLWEMIRKSGADEIVLDWKGLKENKQKIIELTKKTKLKTHRVQDLLK